MIKMSTNVRNNLKSILDRVSCIYNEAPELARAPTCPKLVAVSKTKPTEMVIEAYDAGQRIFGENYVQELSEKSVDPEILQKCPDIKWHFIGTVQSNKVPKIVKSKNLHIVETIASLKLADKFQFCCVSNKVEKLGIFVQVNTSGEENKGGIEPSEVVSVVQHILSKCPNLEFRGLMTIGALAHSIAAAGSDKGSSTEEGARPNPDFVTLIECRRRIAKECGLDERQLELSMGMSNDFEEAIRMGSTNIRVGSSIFGARNTKKPNDIEVKEVDRQMAQVEIKS